MKLLAFLVSVVVLAGAVWGQGSWVPQPGAGQAPWAMVPRINQGGVLPRTIPPNLPKCQHSVCACYWLVTVEMTDVSTAWDRGQTNLPGRVLGAGHADPSQDGGLLMHASAGIAAWEGEPQGGGRATVDPSQAGPGQVVHTVKAKNSDVGGVHFGVYHKRACQDCSGAGGSTRSYIQVQSCPTALLTASSTGNSRYELEFLMVTKCTVCVGASNSLYVLERSELSGARTSLTSYGLPLPMNYLAHMMPSNINFPLSTAHPTNRIYSSTEHFDGKHTTMEEVLMIGRVKLELEARPTAGSTVKNSAVVGLRDSSHRMLLSFVCPCESSNHPGPPTATEDGPRPTGGVTPGLPGSGGATPAIGPTWKQISNAPHTGGMLVGGLEEIHSTLRALPYPGFRLR